MFRFLKKKKLQRFGEIAIRKGFVSEADVKEALASQKEYKERRNIHKEIGAIMAEKGFISIKDVNGILDEQNSKRNGTAWFSALFGLSR
ncbi:MAG: hypothetical protein ABIG55_04875 [Candidatus Omnitrophota bacterium]|nr:hypothetical protein [Candidatus Omnitrophota bacterium]